MAGLPTGAYRVIAVNRLGTESGPSSDTLVCGKDGRWDTDPIVRLTPEPIRTTEFLDEQAGRGTGRYEVVAVDALGQEGEPSRPVWSRREWGRFYAPYVGQWHQ